MKFTIQIDPPFATHIDPASIENALNLTLQGVPSACPEMLPELDEGPVEGATGVTVSVVVTDTQTVQHLNHQYRGVDAPTDVLSFENIPDPDFPGQEAMAMPHLGDIIIAYPLAEAQALARGHTPADEVILLTVHGTLHLLGFDHDTPANKAAMWAIQQQIMAALNLGHVQPTET